MSCAAAVRRARRARHRADELQRPAADEQPAQQHARGREQEQQAEDVGDEARRQQQDAAEDHEHAVDDLAVRDPALRRAPR